VLSLKIAVRQSRKQTEKLETIENHHLLGYHNLYTVGYSFIEASRKNRPFRWWGQFQ
jgi:hypothetical protein